MSHPELPAEGREREEPRVVRSTNRELFMRCFHLGGQGEVVLKNVFFGHVPTLLCLTHCCAESGMTGCSNCRQFFWPHKCFARACDQMFQNSYDLINLCLKSATILFATSSLAKNES